MMKIHKRTLLCFFVFIVYMLVNIGNSIAVFTNIAYFIIGGICYVTFGLMYHSHYVISLKKRRRIKKILRTDMDKTRPLIRFLNGWLKREGFKVRVNNYGNIYLENKIAIIQYFPSLKQKISVKPKNRALEYLMYDEDEELKESIERYMDYILYKSKDYETKAKSYNIGGLSEPFKYEESFTSMFGKALSRVYGYVFLSAALYDMSYEFFPTTCKICVIILYFIIEAS